MRQLIKLNVTKHRIMYIDMSNAMYVYITLIM